MSGLGQHPVSTQAGGQGDQEQDWQKVIGSAGGCKAGHEAII